MAKPNKHPTVAQQRRINALKRFGCMVAYLLPHFAHQCSGELTKHHTHVGGSRPDRSPFRNHWKQIWLCGNHHQGKDGIDPPEGMGTLPWEERYGTETYFLEEANKLLEESCS